MKEKTGPDRQYKKKSTYQKQEPSYCANCGVQVSNAGRKPRSGRRYCSKPECQAARARAIYQESQRSAPPVEMAPTQCSNPACQAPLPPRPRRVSDDPLGRWCRRRGCKMHQAKMHEAAQINEVATLKMAMEVWKNSAQMIADGLECERTLNLSQSRKKCPDCGLVEGLEGWKHPDGAGRPCEGLIAKGRAARPVHRDALHLAYPVRTYKPGEDEEE